LRTTLHQKEMYIKYAAVIIVGGEFGQLADASNQKKKRKELRKYWEKNELNVKVNSKDLHASAARNTVKVVSGIEETCEGKSESGGKRTWQILLKSSLRA